ncbi:MAG TPA: dihydrofolate reductase family protein [Bacteroidaceae bacterium]|nr:dihydrofolate reductase family protein [Bacteroidaceae bacterium]
MKQIKAHIAVSLDGFIATSDNELEWLPNDIKATLFKQYIIADALIMGANTYHYIFEHWGGWPYKDKQTFVVSHYNTNVTPNCGVKFLTSGLLDEIYKLKHKTDLLVVGGGSLITTLIKAKLINCITIYTVPKLLGNGIKLFPETPNWDLKLMDSTILNGGTICSTYVF